MCNTHHQSEYLADDIDDADGLALEMTISWWALAVPVRQVTTCIQIEQSLEASDVILDDCEVLVLHSAADLDHAANNNRQKLNSRNQQQNDSREWCCEIVDSR